MLEKEGYFVLSCSKGKAMSQIIVDEPVMEAMQITPITMSAEEEYCGGWVRSEPRASTRSS
jgi:hypothetical protein